ncbi:dipeptidase [Benzoatithermus flavus]|uniref:Dipeptidase n=1 Tax=Benzoatithermus flavus TaxID=3108223 RepID=A0ABU8XXD1_9PROT
MPNPIAVFDGHNDTLLRLFQEKLPLTSFVEGSGAGHIDLPRARAGGFKGGLFACFVPSVRPAGAGLPTGVRGYTAEGRTPSLEHAQRVTFALAARLRRLERAGALSVCRSVADIRAAMTAGRLAAVFHIEGAEAIDPELEALEVLHAAGLRSLGPVWSRPNVFGHGVPFRFPSSPDTGPGLTEAGKALVRACNELGIVVDLSHLNEQGFWDVAKLSTAPLVASHSNAHALCPASRNLTDRQLDAIRESGGLVGLNFAAGFLRPDGRDDPDVPLDVLADHLDRLVDRLGIDGVALGSDFDGCTVPVAIRDAAGLPRLFDHLRARGWDEPSLAKLAHENWLRVLERTWGG